jgi:hypothetical protein
LCAFLTGDCIVSTNGMPLAIFNIDRDMPRSTRPPRRSSPPRSSPRQSGRSRALPATPSLSSLPRGPAGPLPREGRKRRAAVLRSAAALWLRPKEKYCGRHEAQL